MISASKFYSVLRSIKDKGYVKVHVINLGGKGSPPNFLEITDEGCKAIGVSPRPHLTRGGDFRTDAIVTWMSGHLKNILPGFKVSIEKDIGGKFIDIVAEDTNKSFVIAIEVESSSANLASNIEKDIGKVDFLIEACACR